MESRYFFLNLKKFDFTGQNLVHAGIYEKVQSAFLSRLPVVVYGWKISDIPIAPSQVTIRLDNGNFFINGAIRVSPSDYVTLEQVIT